MSGGLEAVLEVALRAEGLTDKPDEFDGDMHSWRCSYPEIYGRCSCFAEFVSDLAAAINAHLAQVALESRTAVAEALLLEHMDGDMLVGAGRGIDNDGEDVAIGHARAAEVAFWAAGAAVGAFLARVGGAL